MVYATGTFWSVTPDSRVKVGTMAMCWSGIRDAKGFSGCAESLSTGFSHMKGFQVWRAILTQLGDWRVGAESFCCHCAGFLQASRT